MFSQSIADLALILVQLGFAVFLGLLARHAKAWPQRLAFTLAVLAYITSSLAMPLYWPVNAVTGVGSVLVFVLAMRLPSSTIWQFRVAWWYAGFAMLAILVWSATQGWLSPVFLLGLAAAFAAALSWRRGLAISASQSA